MHTDSESSSNSRKEMLPKPITIVTSESSSSCYIRSPVSEEFTFSAAQGATAAGQVCEDQTSLGFAFACFPSKMATLFIWGVF